MNIWIAFLSAVVGYLIGAVSFSRMVARQVSPKIDLERIVVKDPVTGAEYQRAVNASTISMSLGWKAGCLISLLDMLKVTLPVLAFKLVFPELPYFLIAAVAALVGNNWPVYYRFKGGSGISAIYGGLLAIDPLAVVAAPAAGLVFGLFLLRSFAVMFILSLVFIIPWLWFRFHEVSYNIYSIAVNMIYLLLFVKDAKAYLRPGTRVMSEKEVMSQMPMGRGMIRMIEKLGLNPDGSLMQKLEQRAQFKK